MAGNAGNVRVAVTGGVFKGDHGATAPTGTSGAPTGHVDLGYIGEDGVEIEMPGEGDSTPIKAWQNNTTVRTIRSASDDSPTWSFVMLETKLETIETYFGVTVTQSATEGSFEYTVSQREPFSLVVDAVDGAELLRDYIPSAVVTDVESHVLSSTGETGYGVTVAGDFDATAGFNFKRWATALKSA